MGKPETHAAVLEQTQNGKTRDTGIIGTGHIMDKPETQGVFRKDRVN
jgi:hypothetical protein